MSTEEQVEVTVQCFEDGLDGPGWCAWESDSPEEGYFYVAAEQPTAEQLKAIHPSYAEKN